jgi:Sulfotransferase domain
MGLKVIGTGLGRTGTKSMQTALVMLGFGPCHHMVEVIQHPETLPLWIEAGEGRADWDAIFKDYHSAVDYPSAAYWRELTSYYPNAKVLHTVRDPEEWFESAHATIMSPGGISRRDGGDMVSRFFLGLRQRVPFEVDDRAAMIEYFRRHTEAVTAAIPRERLLVHQMGEGWERLCRFLEVPVPREPFPFENSRAEFISRVLSQPGGPAPS